MLQSTSDHKNNFDFLRFLFASLVIFSHSFALLTTISDDPTHAYTGRVLSEVSVCGFFVISGYLIQQSLSRSSSLYSYIRKRILRIFPGLIVAVLLTVLVCSFFSDPGLMAYWSNKNTWLYIPDKILLLPTDKDLPGIFTHNVEKVSNGSLWTLRYEVFFYAVLAGMFTLSLVWKKRMIPFLFVLCFCTYFLMRNDVLQIPGGLGKFVFYCAVLGNYFLGGATLSLFPVWLKKYKSIIFPVSAILFFFSFLCFQKILEPVNILALIFMVLSFGLYYFKPMDFSRYTGDISYGTYIYAFPIQQILVVCLHTTNPYLLMIPSFLLSWAAGLLSYNLIEKRFLKRKRQNL